MSRSIVIGVAMCAAACGTDVSPGDPISRERAEAVCRDTCDHMLECGWTEDLGCSIQCRDFAESVRGDLVLDVTDCIVALECTASIDSCSSLVEQLEPLPSHLAIGQRCEAKPQCVVVDCAELVDEVKLFTDAIAGEIEACFDLPCEDVQRCVEDRIDAVF